MLHPIFDKDCDLVGWVQPNCHICDTDMNWAAYIINGHAWSSDSGNWLGPYLWFAMSQSSRKTCSVESEGIGGGHLTSFPVLKGLACFKAVEAISPVAPYQTINSIRWLGAGVVLRMDRPVEFQRSAAVDRPVRCRASDPSAAFGRSDKN